LTFCLQMLTLHLQTLNLMLNISETTKDTAIVVVEWNANRKLYPNF